MNEAVVIAVGPGDKVNLVIPLYIISHPEKKPCSVKAGDKVLLPPFGGNNVKLGQEEFIIYKDAEILAKLESK